MENTEYLEYLKVLYTLAWADKEIQEEEIKILTEVQNLFELETSEKIEHWKNNPLKLDDLKDIDFNSWSLDKKKYILLLSITIAESDGIYTIDEKNMVEDISNMLNLKGYTKEKLLEEVKNDNELL